MVFRFRARTGTSKVVTKEASGRRFTAFREITVEGSLRGAKVAAEAGVERLVYLIRIVAQGDRNEEGAPFVCDEDPSPTDPCGISNAEAEDCLTNHLPEPGLS